MAILRDFEKQPRERKDYDVEYIKWLTRVQDVIASFKTHVECLTDPDDSSLEIYSSDYTDMTIKLWVSGGEDEQRYKVTILMTTAGGRTDESEVIFRIKDH